MRRYQEISTGFLLMQPAGDRGPTVAFHARRLRTALADVDQDSPEAARHQRALARLTKAAARIGIVIEEPTDARAA